MFNPDTVERRKEEAEERGTTPEAVAKDQLLSIVERIERLEEEKRTIGEDLKDVYAEAKGNGFEPKIIRKIIALRRRDPDERAEENAVTDLYLHALGMIPELPEDKAEPRLPMDDDRLQPVPRKGAKVSSVTRETRKAMANTASH